MAPVYNSCQVVHEMKKRGWKMVLAIIGGLITLAVVGLFALSLTASVPETVGLKNGRLAECPDSPNCVSSQASDAGHRIEPIRFEGSADGALDTLSGIVAASPRTTIVSRNSNYIHAEATSAFFRFTDDVEFLLDPAERVIHVRSASRVGKSDFGVNRKRVETLREKFHASN